MHVRRVFGRVKKIYNIHAHTASMTSRANKSHDVLIIILCVLAMILLLLLLYTSLREGI